MPKRRTFFLTPEQEGYLLGVRDHDPRPYLRERAAALLKIAGGMSPHSVALHGLLKPRDPDTVYAWMDAFARDGFLRPRPPCRGPFSPSGSGARGRPGASPPPSRPHARAGGLDARGGPPALPRAPEAQQSLGGLAPSEALAHRLEVRPHPSAES